MLKDDLVERPMHKTRRRNFVGVIENFEKEEKAQIVEWKCNTHVKVPTNHRII
jgi:hypothetical protein